MPFLFVFLVAGLLLLVFAQFGNRLSANHAFSWWLIGLFLILVTISPELLRPLADILGIKLISNFVLASMVFFLLVHLVELASSHTKVKRSLRDLVATTAAQEFLREHRKVNKSENARSLVVLPCYNEEQEIEQIIKRMASLIEQYPLIDYVIVNDGSVDDTGQILEHAAKGKYVTHITNTGVSGALLTGFKISRGLNAEFVVQCDSDGQHPIEDIPKLLSIAARESTDLLIGSRFIGKGRSAAGESTTKLRLIGSWLISSCLRAFGDSSRTLDPTSGFRVYSRKAVAILSRNLPDEYPEPESIAILAIAGARVAETPVAMKPRTTGRSSLSGLKSGQYMLKVVAALVGLRLRSFLGHQLPR